MPKGRFKLQWNPATFRPSLETQSALPTGINALCSCAATSVSDVFKRYLSQERYESATINLSCSRFTHYIRGILDSADSASATGRNLMLQLVAGFGVSQASGEASIARTPFSFANGQSGMNLFGGRKLETQKNGSVKEKTYAGLRSLAVDANLAAMIRDAVSDGKLQSGYVSFNWSPSEHRPGAFQGPKDTLLSTPGANVLAFFGLSFFPVVPTPQGVTCVGFGEIGGTRSFIWPLWEVSLDEDVVSSILATDWQSMDSLQRSSAGIFALRGSRRIMEGTPPTVRFYFAPSIPL